MIDIDKLTNKTCIIMFLFGINCLPFKIIRDVDVGEKCVFKISS